MEDIKKLVAKGVARQRFAERQREIERADAKRRKRPPETATRTWGAAGRLPVAHRVQPGTDLTDVGAVMVPSLGLLSPSRGSMAAGG
jgi:hypothetical protein